MTKLTVADLMANYTPKPNFEGFEKVDDVVLALDLDSTNTDGKVAQYIVAQFGISSETTSLNPTEETINYIRMGGSSVKMGNQRTFQIDGDRYHGDFFQDEIMKLKFATGQKAIVNYVLFNVLTGNGEKGKVTVLVDQDQGGNAGENSKIQITLKAVGTPEDFTYSADAVTLKNGGTQETEQDNKLKK